VRGIPKAIVHALALVNGAAADGDTEMEREDRRERQRTKTKGQKPAMAGPAPERTQCSSEAEATAAAEPLSSPDKRAAPSRPSTAEEDDAHTSALSTPHIPAGSPPATIASHLAQLAADVLQNHALLVAGEHWEVLEVEVYLRAPPHHYDLFTHAADEQRRSGVWYFHRSGDAMSLF
jgi:hypothetical protein